MPGRNGMSAGGMISRRFWGIVHEMNTYFLRVYSYTFTEIVLKIVKSSLTSVVPKTQFTHHLVYSPFNETTPNPADVQWKRDLVSFGRFAGELDCFRTSTRVSFTRQASLPLTIQSRRSIAINQLWIAEHCTIFPNTVVETVLCFQQQGIPLTMNELIVPLKRLETKQIDFDAGRAR